MRKKLLPRFEENIPVNYLAFFFTSDWGEQIFVLAPLGFRFYDFSFRNVQILNFF